MASIATLRAELKDFDQQATTVLDELFGWSTNAWISVATYTPSPGVLSIAYLCEPAAAAKALESTGFDLGIDGGYPHLSGEAGEVVYRSIGHDPRAIPLVFVRSRRNLPGPPVALELAEDFRLFWGLHGDPDRGEFVFADDDGDRVVVARQTDSGIVVSKRFLRRYQAARQLTFVVQVVAEVRGGEELASWEGREVEIEGLDSRVVYHGNKSMGSDGWWCQLAAKRVWDPQPHDECGVPPFDETFVYESFIVGADEEGQPISFTCDPDSVQNYSGSKNANAPHFLTPVFFDRAVLERYFSDPEKFRVADGTVFGPSWVLQTDDGRDDFVVVFLGDLGQSLTAREQRHWRTYNVVGDGRLSDAGFTRSILGEFVESERVEHRFYAAYDALQHVWEARFGWRLFLTPNEGDAHIAHTVHVPSNASGLAFDQQIIVLTKLVADSLNEAEVSKLLAGKISGEKGIGKFGRLLIELSIDLPSLPTRLSLVVGARNHSAAHLKSSTFELAILLDGAPDLPSLFDRHLANLADQFDQLRSLL